MEIDTGQDLIKTGFQMLAESGDSGAIKGLADITNALEARIRDLLEKLQEIREKIVLMQDCYKTLNKVCSTHDPGLIRIGYLQN